MTNEITLMGVPGSPYTRKMLALLRYRRIPYRLILGSQRLPNNLPRPKVPLLPTFFFENAADVLEPVTDSTPIIRRLEKMSAGRSVIPPDPALAFLDYVFEDYGDEWLTKAMFHYRWYYRADIETAGSTLPFYPGVPLSDEQHARLKKEISERQISRLYVVGSNPITAAVIEESYVRYLHILNNHLRTHRFHFGARPSAGDFGAQGQLTQLARFDPTPMAVTMKEAPRVSAWVETLEDLSGLEVSESDWLSRDQAKHALRPFFEEVGRTYVPVMLANAKAIADGAPDVRLDLEGKPWVQKPFPYQAKCVGWVREAFAGLSKGDQAWVSEFLDGSGCEQLIRV